MLKLVECVPNISEGRDSKIIGAVADAVRNSPGVTLLDISSDESHNRTVITFLGEPSAVGEAAIALSKAAARLIDMTKHRGAHPRMGAVDVMPFIPVRDMTTDEAVLLSREVGRRLWEEIGIPVFLYEASSTAPHRENLAEVRKGQFEGMPEKLLLPEWEPDFGGCEIHPTAGVTAVGARMPLIAYNINLSTSDITVADRISRIIRRSGGGFDCVKAIGVMLEERNTAQVSINMTDFTRTPLYRVLECVRTEAARWGVTVTDTEIVGLTPVAALVDCAQYYLQLVSFDTEKQILENRITD